MQVPVEFRWWLPRVLLCFGLGAGGCASSPKDEPDAGDDGGGDADSDADADPLDEFFGLSQVHDIEIEVDDFGVQSLINEPKEYVPGSIRIGDAVLEQVGVRLKGGFGSFIPLGEDDGYWGHGNGKPGKNGFIVDFNRYVGGQNYQGLEKLTLNNGIQDPSGIAQFVGYALFREGEVPASRSGFGTVSFNGEDKGLYVLVEPPDNDEFLDRWYGADDGNLYEGDMGADLTGEDAPQFDQDHGSDTSKQDVIELGQTLDAIGPGEDGWEVLDAAIDMDEYLTYIATELYLAHWDGYAWSTNNYVIHHDVVGGGWTFLPWGIDQLFDTTNFGGFGGVMKSPGPSWEPPDFGIAAMFHGGRVQELCFDSPTCMARLAEAFADVIERVDAMELYGLAEQARELVEPLLLEESTAYGDPGWTVAALDRVFDYLDERGGELAGWLPCLTGGAVDHDDDGYDGCSADCDDMAETTHPDADELCNLVDDDCNALIDDDDADACPKCIDLGEPLDGEHSFCFELLSWADARQYCLDRGQELASFHDADTAQMAGWYAMEMLGVVESWIGLNDQATEGEYVWSDGTPLDYTNWIIEYPPEWTYDLDCVVHHAFLGWLPDYCALEMPFICKTP